MNYICPVCGFDKLVSPPSDEKGNESYDICSCCGFEYGVDDFNYGLVNAFEKYRRDWVDNGAEWFYPSFRPINWNIDKQLKNITSIKPIYMPFYLRDKG
jgi:hypothetical protein